MSQPPKRQALRTRPASPQLEALIELVNLVPPTLEFPDIREDLATSNVSASDYQAKFIASLQEGLPREACQPFWDFFDPYFLANWGTAVGLYGDLVAARLLLRAVATSSKEVGPFNLPPGSGALVHAEIGQDGKMRFINGNVAGILELVEVARIRLCPICGVIYWAGRINKPGCGPRCINAIRQLRHRGKYSARYFERYKQQRYRRMEQKVKANTAHKRSPSRIKLPFEN